MVSIGPVRAASPISVGEKRISPSKGNCGRFEDAAGYEAALAEGTGGDRQSVSILSEVKSDPTQGDRCFPTEVVVDQVQQLIDTLEAYQKKIMEKEVRLSEIQPIIKKMTAESQSLSEVSKQLSPTDRLRSIVNQSLILSSAEIIKFNSGFYNEIQL